jgi:hypothetical protein
MRVVRDAIHHVNISEIQQALTWKVMALKTPRYFLLHGTLAKTVPALYTGGKYLIGEAAIAGDLFDRNTGFLGYPV